MSNFCINCGSKGTLEAMPVPEGEDQPLIKRGVFDGHCYDKEQEVSILNCTSCKHEMVDLSS